MQIYCYSKCSTCRKALKYLDAKGIAYTVIDLVADTPDAAALAALIERSGLPAKKFFNTSGKRYRELGIKDKATAMDTAEVAELLATDGMLIKRPIFDTGSAILVGFKEDAWDAALQEV